jgi:hypothetical protein
MRPCPIAGSVLLVVAMALLNNASAEPARRAKAPGPSDGRSLLSEFRFGFSAHDPWGPEQGSPSVAGEILLSKPFTPADLFASYFVPRPHVGGSLTFDRSSYAYAGLTWTVDLTSRMFVEGSLGGAIRNGKTDTAFASLDRQRLGCSPLFREAGSVGVRLSASWSLVATVEHLSDRGACAENRGLTNIGARVGYSF